MKCHRQTSYSFVQVFDSLDCFGVFVSATNRKNTVKKPAIEKNSFVHELWSSQAKRPANNSRGFPICTRVSAITKLALPMSCILVYVSIAHFNSFYSFFFAFMFMFSIVSLQGIPPKLSLVVNYFI